MVPVASAWLRCRNAERVAWLRVLEPVTPAGGLPAFFGDREPWVGFVVCDDLVDGAMCDSPDSCVVFDGPLEARSDEVRGPRLDAEPVLLLDAEGPVELSGPVLSAWATPDPLRPELRRRPG